LVMGVWFPEMLQGSAPEEPKAWCPKLRTQRRVTPRWRTPELRTPEPAATVKVTRCEGEACVICFVKMIPF
jgi:hypothetical protein